MQLFSSANNVRIVSALGPTGALTYLTSFFVCVCAKAKKKKHILDLAKIMELTNQEEEARKKKFQLIALKIPKTGRL